MSYTVCLQDRKRILTSEPLRPVFLETLADAAAKFDCISPIYCLMPDHAHIVLTGASEKAHPNHAMYALKQKMGYWLKRNMPELAFQKDFHDHVMRAYEDFNAHILYVFANPVRAGLVDDPVKYPWSGSIGCNFEEVVHEAMFGF